jgi:cytochrome b subunit of formate dehydrogenase
MIQQQVSQQQAPSSEPDRPTATAASKLSAYRRFSVFQRLEHILLLVSFTVLGITGLPQKYSAQPWATTMIGAMGGIEFTRLIHRSAAVILLAVTIYHFVAVAYRIYVKRAAMTMLPGWQDAKDALQTLGHNIGLYKVAPRMGRYTFGEKVEYWAVIWGTVIMAITGFMLWNPIATTSFLPGEFIPAAKAAHGGEAILAVLSILTWHFYNVHLKHFNKSMFTGDISRHEMVEEHPQELAQIEVGRTRLAPDPATQRQRMRIFVPFAVVLSLALLIGLYLFVAYEQTATPSVPSNNVEVFVRATPATIP